MKFLIDNALSPLIAEGLKQSGYNAAHVRDFSMQAVADDIIFQFAAKKGYTIISADTDFGTLLALRQEIKPSVILIRRGSQRHPQLQLNLFLSNLPNIKDFIEQGSIIVFNENKIRIRLLPIGGKQ